MISGEAGRPIIIPPAARREVPAEPASLGPSDLGLLRLCRRVAEACARQPGDPAIHQTVGAILAEAASDPGLLHGVAAGSCAQRYTRHLLADGAGYCILAIVWLPGQRSPVHSHLAWCSLAVQSGVLTETRFTPTAGGPTPSFVRLLHPGCGSHGEATGGHAHQVANCGDVPAVSLHAYGLSFDRLATDLNRVWAD